MCLSQLSEQEKQIILQSMKAVLESGELEFEYDSRLGVEEDEFRKIIKRFPNLDDSLDDSNDTLAINNSLNEICYGIKFTEDKWRKFFTQNFEEIEHVYRKWARMRGWKNTQIR